MASLLKEEVNKFKTNVSLGKPLLKYESNTGLFTQEPIENSPYTNAGFIATVSFCDACGRLSPRKLGAPAYKDFLQADKEKFAQLFNSDFGQLPLETIIFIPVVQKHAISMMLRYKIIRNDTFYDLVTLNEKREPDWIDVNEKHLLMKYKFGEFAGCKLSKYYENGDTGFVAPSCGLNVQNAGLDLYFPIPTTRRNYDSFGDFMDEIENGEVVFEDLIKGVKLELDYLDTKIVSESSVFIYEIENKYDVAISSTRSWKIGNIIHSLSYGKTKLEATLLEILSASEIVLERSSKKTEFLKLRKEIEAKILKRIIDEKKSSFSIGTPIS